MALLLEGLAFGFVLAATVGPMWVLCFRRTVAAGPLAGFVSGMDIAVADALYGAIAAFGLTALAGGLHERAGPRLMRAINVTSGGTILALALWPLARLV